MRKLFVLVVCLIMIVSTGCSADDQIGNLTNTKIDNTDYNEDELEAIQLEEAYQRSKDNQDLINLCSLLCVMRLDRTEFRHMVLEYFPILFDRCEGYQTGFDHGFASFYAIYVCSCLAEDLKDEYKTEYFEYKMKAENIYYYAQRFYGRALQLNNLTDEDYDFLYYEAIDIYEQAKSDDMDYHSRLNANTVLISIFNAMGKEEELKLYYEKEIKDYMEEQISKEAYK